MKRIQPPSEPSVAVVVVTHDAPGSLRRCVDAILKNTRDVPMRLVVVDNGSGSGTARYLTRLAARGDATIIRHERNEGKAFALNDAVRRLPADWYAFVDDDAAVPPGWLSGLLRAASRARPVPHVVGCRSVLAGGAIHSAEMCFWVGGHGGGERDLGQRSYTRACDVVSGTCLLVRGEVFRGIRFRESMRQQYEDADFCLQARRHGLRVLYCGDVAVRHDHLRRSSSRLVKRNHEFMVKTWGVPVFPDSHALDRLYARLWSCAEAEDWRGVLRAGRRLQAVAPAPAYAAWWTATALCRLGRRQEARPLLRRALARPYVAGKLRARLELAYDRALA